MRAASFLFSLMCVGVVACSSSESSTPTPPNDTGSPGDSAVDSDKTDTPADTGDGCLTDPGVTPKAPVTTTDDPTGGADKFTLDMALEGFPKGTGILVAKITTEQGVITCALDERNAPISVANFVGLARGTRYALASGTWTTKKFYDGLIWHRVIPDFVIQGGDPRGSGTGGPGYSLPNENHAPQDTGVIAMAASQPDGVTFVPSGSQFYIVVGSGPKPDYNVFGACDTDAAIKIAGVPRSSTDKPTTPVHMNIEIKRCPKCPKDVTCP